MQGLTSPDDPEDPAFDLREVVAAFQADRYEVTARVRRHLRRKGWTLQYVEEVVLALRPCDFHKSQDHLSRSGVRLDIYRPWRGGQRMYIKLTTHEEGDKFLVLSFCHDGEAH